MALTYYASYNVARADIRADHGPERPDANQFITIHTSAVPHEKAVAIPAAAFSHSMQKEWPPVRSDSLITITMFLLAQAEESITL